MRGPSDIMQAMLGSERFLLNLIDSPASMKVMVQWITELWIDVLRMQIRHMPPFRGEYVAGSFGVWAPGTVASFQEDACGLLSANTYREFFKPCDGTIAKAFDYALIHLHSARLQMLDEILQIHELNAINIALDPLGPELAELLPVFRRIQAHGKTLHLLGFVSTEEIEMLTNMLHSGLFISVIDVSSNEGGEYEKTGS